VLVPIAVSAVASIVARSPRPLQSSTANTVTDVTAASEAASIIPTFIVDMSRLSQLGSIPELAIEADDDISEDGSDDRAEDSSDEADDAADDSSEETDETADETSELSDEIALDRSGALTLTSALALTLTSCACATRGAAMAATKAMMEAYFIVFSQRA